MKNSKIFKIIYISAIIALAVIFILVVLEKLQITNFYTKPIATVVVAPRPVNDVQYTPANPTDSDETNQKKLDGTIDQNKAPASTGAPINVVLTAAGQDNIGGPVVVRVLLTDVTTGTCTISLTNGSSSKEYVKNVVNAGTYYNCEALDIPIGELTPGSWNLAVTVTSVDRSGTAQQTIEVKQ
ncbi:hypothetical protein H6795_05045 [Candidatus Nomurabacteria bacterium]|nr:hypothetical protein [Candidatus Nomurabacteria bacterium]